MGKCKVRIMSIVVLRMVTMLTCAATIALIFPNKFTLEDGQETNFTAIRGYWAFAFTYPVTVANKPNPKLHILLLIDTLLVRQFGLYAQSKFSAYYEYIVFLFDVATLVKVCFSYRCRGNSLLIDSAAFGTVHAVKGTRLINGQFLSMFDFYGDKVMAFLLASGVGVSIELKNFIDESIDINEENALRVEFRVKSDKFFDRGIIASGILLVGFTTMAILTILNSAKHTGKSF